MFDFSSILIYNNFMKKIILTLTILVSSLLSQEYTLNITGDAKNENHTVKVDFKVDEDGKILPAQKYDIRNLGKPNSLKILTAPGLKGTLKDEREIVVFYKTSLDVSGLKIRNLYKVAHTRVYGDENNISLTFDKDHFQNIISYLRYHNIKQDVINDINNMYGTWEEIE